MVPQLLDVKKKAVLSKQTHGVTLTLEAELHVLALFSLEVVFFFLINLNNIVQSQMKYECQTSQAKHLLEERLHRRR